eukprot:6183440-Pleurochrysis_carterae.AAC.1
MERLADDEQELAMDFEEDDDYAPSADDLREEKSVEPLPWASEGADTNLYGKERAVSYFNQGMLASANTVAGAFVPLPQSASKHAHIALCTPRAAMQVATDLYELAPTL